jgi:hypothetical protein
LSVVPEELVVPKVQQELLAPEAHLVLEVPR